MEEALLKWVGTLNIPDSSSSLQQVASPKVIAAILRQLDPYFHKNLVAKHQSLYGKYNCIVTTICNHARECSRPIGPWCVPSPSLCANHNPAELIKLLSLVLVTAVTGENNYIYIAGIRGLDPKVQTALMNIISTVEGSGPKFEDMGLISPQIQSKQCQDCSTLLLENQKLMAQCQSGARQSNHVQSLENHIAHLESSHASCADELSSYQDTVADLRQALQSQTSQILALKQTISIYENKLATRSQSPSSSIELSALHNKILHLQTENAALLHHPTSQNGGAATGNNAYHDHHTLDEVCRQLAQALGRMAARIPGPSRPQGWLNVQRASSRI
uniref:ARAD1D39622p n=1 Tax=Blastobotrys adeninivorans TaxID=409370 RepID=A0A060TC63_BLAAD